VKKSIAWSLNAQGKPERLAPGSIDLEKSLEDWVEADPSIVADDVLLIGRQVPTGYGTVLDLLGMDSDGNLVVIELKRDQTLRETVAQSLEYAAWASKLLYDDIVGIATTRFTSSENFTSAFEARFGQPLPVALNDHQRILLVAPEISDSTAAVIEYLSESYGVPINGISFDVFGLGDRQLLVRHFVREEATEKAPPGKSRPARTIEQFLSASEENGVRDIVEHLLTMKDILPSVERYVHSFALKTRAPDKRPLAAFSVYPTAETEAGVVHLVMSPANLSALYGRTEAECEDFVRDIQSIGTPGKGWQGWAKTIISKVEQARKFDRRFRAFISTPAAQLSTVRPDLA
jgi:hypothetical protein